MTDLKTSGYELASIRALKQARKLVTGDDVPDGARFLVDLAGVYATLELAEAVRGSAPPTGTGENADN